MNEEPYSAHDYDDPRGYLNALEMAAYSATTVLCIHCHATSSMLPMTGTAWGLDISHEPSCPLHEDNGPALVHEDDA